MSIYNHYTIYKITNLINNKVYIGQTIQLPEKRWNAHKSKSRTYEGSDVPLLNAIRKHRIKNFTFEPICSCFDIGELNRKEIYFIEKYKSTNRDFGYNIHPGGHNNIPTIETRKKLSNACLGRSGYWKGKKLSKSHCEKLSISHIGKMKGSGCGVKKGNIPWNKGLKCRPLSESQKNKQTVSLTGRPWPKKRIKAQYIKNFKKCGESLFS